MLMRILLKIFFVLFLWQCLSASTSMREICRDYSLLDGSEPIAAFGMDTTLHWWAITIPFTNQYRLIVDGDFTDTYENLTIPVFSPDGQRWSAFGIANGELHLINESETLILPGAGQKWGEIVYSGDSETLVYSYSIAGLEYIVGGRHKYSGLQRHGKLFVSYDGKKIAFTGYRGSNLVLSVNGRESQLFDDILPVGFWNDGNMLYAAKSGNSWQIYIGDKAVTESFTNVTEAQMNRFGTVAGFAVSFLSGEQAAVLIADEYYEPLIGRTYSKVMNITLHPEIPIMVYNAIDEYKNLVVMNTVEYDGGFYSGKPVFSYDGEDLLFIGCDEINCFASINGRKYKINTSLNVRDQFAIKPGSGTICYSTSASMIVRYLESNRLHAGMMVDQIVAPRYNWRYKCYETLGRINERLYLLTCSP